MNNIRFTRLFIGIMLYLTFPKFLINQKELAGTCGCWIKLQLYSIAKESNSNRSLKAPCLQDASF